MTEDASNCEQIGSIAYLEQASKHILAGDDTRKKNCYGTDSTCVATNGFSDDSFGENAALLKDGDIERNAVPWALPKYMGEGTVLGQFLAYEVGMQIRLQRLNWLKPVAWLMHYIIKEEPIFLIMPFLAWMLTPRIGLNALMCMSVTEYINGVIKWAIAVPRPFWVFKDIENKDGCWEGDYSTPSGHTQLITTLAVILCLDDSSNIPMWIALLSVAFTTGICRVYSGVHYFHDVLAGWFVGASIACTWNALQPLSRVENIAVSARVFTFLALVTLPVLILERVRAMTPGLSRELQQQYETQAQSKLKPGFNPKKCCIKVRSLYTYILPLAVVSGGALGLFLARGNGWSGFDQRCALSDIPHNVIRALAGSGVQLLLFALAMVLPSYLVEHCGVPELPCRLGQYVACMGATVWIFAWLHISAQLNFHSCPVAPEWKDGWFTN